MVTPEMLRAVLRYKPETGRLFFRDSGACALDGLTRSGYRVGTVLGKQLLAHRVIWAIVHGAWPEQIDHINGVSDDNRLVNLRDVSAAENLRNKGRYKRNTSGVSGVMRIKAGWGARIGRQWLGSFPDKDAAIAARRAAEARMGYHENHGRAV